MYVGTDHPALKYLYAHVRDAIARDWYVIGVELFDPGDEQELNIIQKNHPGDAKECAAEMFKLWLSVKPEASWDKLLKVLRKPHIKLNALAVKIERMVSEGMYLSTLIFQYNYVRSTVCIQPESKLYR